MKAAKPYNMELRAAAAEATRERILVAAAEVFLERWYDDVTLAELAKRAGVSGQTVINHYGGKGAARRCGLRLPGASRSPFAATRPSPAM